jgi:uncharacterized protein
MMTRLLFFALVVGVVWWLLRSRSRPAAPPPPGASTPAPMVACAHCGLHLPQSDAPADAAGRYYCSEAHRAAGPR